MRALLLGLTWVAAIAGCLQPFRIAPMDVDMNWGDIYVHNLTVEREASGLAEVGAHVRVILQFANAERPQLVVTLDDEGCSDYGPPTEPSDPTARETRALPDDRANQTYTFDSILRGPARPGAEASVYVGVDAENAIGPIFGECREFSRV